MDGILYSLKLSRILPADRNRPDVIEGRHEYANWFLEEANIHHPVFIDECGFNIWTARSQGRARVGECANRKVCGQKGRQPYHLAGGVSSLWFGASHHSDGWDDQENPSLSFSQVLLPTLMKMKLNISFSMEHHHIAYPSSQETTYICVYCQHTHHS